MIPRIYIWRLLALLWAANLFVMSTESFSGNASRPLLARLFDILSISISSQHFGIIHLAIRKLAHLLEYAVFGSLLYRSFRAEDHPAWQFRCAAWALAVAAAYSLTDELHQASSPGRTASLVDCAIDSTGALLAMLLTYGFSIKARAEKHC